VAIKIPPLVSTQDASDTDYDNASSGLVATDVQAAIDELALSSGTTASPGYSFGRSGNVGSGSYLLNETVPSNIAGRPVYLTTAKITDISVSSEQVDTFNVRIEEHNGVTFTTLTTVSIVAARSGIFSVNIPVTTGKMIAVKISSGSAKNPVVTVQLKGTI
jgi:hypothetical protein